MVLLWGPYITPISFAPDCSTTFLPLQFFFNLSMPVFLAVSTKAAITTGALIGGAVAIIANNERLLEIAARALRRGADVLHKRATERKHRVAYRMEGTEGASDNGSTERDFLRFDEDDTHSDMTTPSSTDVELSDIEDIDYNSDNAKDGDVDDILAHEDRHVRRRNNELIVEEVD